MWNRLVCHRRVEPQRLLRLAVQVLCEESRGGRVSVGVGQTLLKGLCGPTSRTDGTENLLGALRTAMGMCGVRTIRDFQKVELMVAPAIKTEGKQIQMAQR